MIRFAAAAAFALAPSSAQQAPQTPPPVQTQAPQTKPEATEYKETSRAADVAQFLQALAKLPHAERLQTSVAGKTTEGRELQLVRVALPDSKPESLLRVLVVANIHAGEVEGKEAVQMLLREFAQGEHDVLLKKCALWFVPIYNVDGN